MTGTLSFLDRNRSAPTVQMQPPSQGTSQSSALAMVNDTAGDAYISLQGRASLTLLAVLIVGAVVFYMWTRDAQGS